MHVCVCECVHMCACVYTVTSSSWSQTYLSHSVRIHCPALLTSHPPLAVHLEKHELVIELWSVAYLSGQTFPTPHHVFQLHKWVRVLFSFKINKCVLCETNFSKQKTKKLNVNLYAHSPVSDLWSAGISRACWYSWQGRHRYRLPHHRRSCPYVDSCH